MRPLKAIGCRTSISGRINRFFCFVILMQEVKEFVEQEIKMGMRAFGRK